MARRSRTAVMVRSDPGLVGGIAGGGRALKKLGHKVSRFFHKGDRKADAARHQFNLERNRVAELTTRKMV